MKYLVGRIRSLLQSREFWEEYSFYICYVALLGFIVQVVLLDVAIHDYLAVLGLQLVSLFASALIFVGLKTHYQPSNYWTKLGYFILANGPWLGLVYYWLRGMGTIDLIIYAGLMLLITAAEGCFYDRLFDHCCDRAYRLRTLYRKRKHRH